MLNSQRTPLGLGLGNSFISLEKGMLNCWNDRHDHAPNPFPIKIWVCKDNDSMTLVQALNPLYILIIDGRTSSLIGLHIEITFEIDRIITPFNHNYLGNFLFHYLLSNPKMRSAFAVVAAASSSVVIPRKSAIKSTT
ncbi:Uncharacterised protein [Streptococcus pneumoniae]|nr:Uncharacterised protein [Streptococcus pneumoniae]